MAEKEEDKSDYDTYLDKECLVQDLIAFRRAIGTSIWENSWWHLGREDEDSPKLGWSVGLSLGSYSW